ncbi:type III-B CRISPR module-associated Cmr3 family protein [Thiococcus pfennigii]|uniref:type III-B CRISPR module-associated Cmr3 family protein n=1 Tax=Thiococcus pfennigii TaxID=1057 RepID=UPI001904100F|nr:type III-B CRISPR module-associated Cmr3 family protein [Thiococcus pfennigii]MBK1700193.1 hypothetical protein [Thiococcus pfennigii]
MIGWWHLDPADVWFFRDAKPFTAGESHRAESRFPPSPATVLGALRTALIAHAPGLDFEAVLEANDARRRGPAHAALLELIGSAEQPGRLAVRGPFLCRRQGDDATLLLKPPLDLLGRNWLTPLTPAQLPGLVANAPALRLLWSGGSKGGEEVPKDRWIALSTLLEYLAEPSKAPPTETPGAEVFRRETRTGLELGAGRTAKPGLFYIADMLRMLEDPSDGGATRCGLAFRADGLPAGLGLPEGPLALGGKSRAAVLASMRGAAAQDLDRLLAAHAQRLKPVIQRTGRFRVYAATPALFRGGWCPDWLAPDGDGYCGQLPDGTRVELVAAAVDKPEPVGGWNLAARCPKPLYRAVPAGSVYCFQVAATTPLADAVVEALITRFHFAEGFRADGASALPAHLTAGFGLTLIGTWNPLEGINQS